MSFPTNWPRPMRPRNGTISRAQSAEEIGNAAAYLAGRRRCGWPCSLRDRPLASGSATGFWLNSPIGPLDHRVLAHLVVRHTTSEAVDLSVSLSSDYGGGETASLPLANGMNHIELVVDVDAGSATIAPDLMPFDLTLTCSAFSLAPPSLVGVTLVPLPFGAPWGPDSV